MSSAITYTPAEKPKIDRQKTCPLLLRVFFQVGAHHRETDFAEKGREPTDEMQIYTWKDATLREIATLIQSVNEKAKSRDAALNFKLVFPDREGRTEWSRWGECTRS
eukprot:TRINITY_DN1527_c0_g1_i1.p1 TRINITY_DN1527_c0_g1~~TRINITY_DN1527_c0_g1_i1.p1  ORF type:complete len:125 (+),score=34.22 TRINITY_DN1527_c0_g1_i1:55-375(+)